MREGRDGEEARRREEPRAGGEGVGIAEPVDGLGHRDDEGEGPHHVEQTDPGRAETGTGHDRDRGGSTGGEERDPVRVPGALDRGSDERETDRPDRDDDRQVVRRRSDQEPHGRSEGDERTGARRAPRKVDSSVAGRPRRTRRRTRLRCVD